jgi:hypothetical protein
MAGDTSGVLQLATNGTTTAMTISTAQNVGIGTTSPTAKLQVSRAGGSVGSTNLVYVDVTSSFGGVSINSTANNNTFVELMEAGTKVGGFNADTTNNVTSIQSDGGHTLAFNTGGTTERMRIDTSGNVLIGTTSNKGSGLTVQSGGNAVWTTSTTSDQSGLVVQNSGVNTGSSADLVAFQIGTSGGGTGVGSIKYNGSLTVYATTSDYRLKENVKPMVGALSIVSQLNPVTYNWTESKVKGQGFIAHELQAAIPDAVVGIKDAVDSKGNAVYQQIDTSVLVATLTAAIQEQQSLINNLTTRLNALEGK